MLTALRRKVLRDLMRTKGQSFAVAMVLACGVAMFVMWSTTLHSLSMTMRQYYNEYRFADVFAHLERAPTTLRPRIAEIPGVSQVQTRVIADVNLDLPGVREPAVGRLISIPERQAAILNDLHIRRGRWIEPDRRGEVLVSETFADAHGYRPGDTLRAVINGRLRTLTIVGVALSPEYIYEIREGDLLPDNRRFGVLWIGESELAAAFDMEGAFNSVALSVRPDASTQDVIDRLDALLDRYGGLGAFSRDDQTSHSLVSGEMEQLQAMIVITPVVFFAVALFLLNMVMSRMVGTQREQIASLKAFGYTRREIGQHYLEYVFAIALVGVVLGIVAGAYFGQGVTRWYVHFFRFPDHRYVVDTGVLIMTLLIGVGVASLGALGAVRRAVRLPAAEAMRPEPPATYRATVVERLGVQRLLSQSWRIVLRNLERHPLRAAITTLGIAFAASVLILGSFSADVVDFIIEHEFHQVQRQDVTVTFTDAVSGRSVRELQRMPGVLHAEGYRSVPATLRFEHRSERVGIMGLPAERTLTRLLDDRGEPVEVPRRGLLLTDSLAEKLGVGLGDVLTVEVMERERPVRQVEVSGLVRQFTGRGVWMDLDATHAMMREQDKINGAQLRVDMSRADELYDTLKATPGIAGVTIKRAAIDGFMDVYAEVLLRMRAVNILFGAVIAIGVVYNAARITFAERSHELATLRVIGFTRGEVSAILFGELAVLTLVAIPLGLVIGHYFSAMAVIALDTDDLRFPLVIHPSTYATAAVVVLISTVISGLIVRRGVDRLDMVAVLKTGT